MGLVVSTSQNTFVERRQSLDAVLTANEAIDSRLKNGLNGMKHKLDKEKAYDYVSWAYLLEIL